MTIKEIEKELNIPRATVRFYEKEGLLEPSREENGYRDYSSEDVERIKKIVIFRKIGLSVSDIEDLLDGAAELPGVLDENIANLEKSLEELKGALYLSKKLKEEAVTMASFNTEDYWSIVDEEEKKGNRFFDVAKDIARVEKNVILSYFGWADKEGNLYDPKKSILNTLLALAILGAVWCLIGWEWNVKTFLKPVRGIIVIIVAELVLSVPLFFLGKKHPWIAEHRHQVLIIACLLAALVTLLILVLLSSV